MPIVTKVIQLKDIQGNLLLPHAYSASKDNNGNDIPNTYATITTVNTKANDSEVVHNTGTETIAGAKTFSTTPIVGTLTQDSSSNAAASTSYVRTAISDEDALVVHLTGDEEIAGTKTFTCDLYVKKSLPHVFCDKSDALWSDNPEESGGGGNFEIRGSDGAWGCIFGSEKYTDGRRVAKMQVMSADRTISDRIHIGINSSNVSYTYAPTPASATDNSNQIATTSWVRNHRCTTAATTTSTASVDAPAYVVQNYKSGASWYRVWSDGWIEQGGASTAGVAADSSATITMHKAMSDTNYCLQVTSSNFTTTSHTGAYNLFIQTYTLTTTKFTVGAKSDNGKMYRVPFSWYVCGY